MSYERDSTPFEAPSLSGGHGQPSSQIACLPTMAATDDNPQASNHHAVADSKVNELGGDLSCRRCLPVPSGAKLLPTSGINDFDKLPKLESLVEDVIRIPSVVMVYGASGSAKSTLCLDLAKAICTGLPWAGHSVRAGNVLYCCLEGGAGLRQRITAIERHFGTAFGDHLRCYFGDFNVAAESEVNDMACTAIAHDVVLIIIDTLSASLRGELDENSNRDMSRMLKQAYRLAGMTGTSVVIVHHSGHGRDRERGASTLRNDVDTSILVSLRDKHGTWKVVKSKDGPTGIGGRFDLVPMESVHADGVRDSWLNLHHVDVSNPSAPPHVPQRKLSELQASIFAAVKAALEQRTLHEAPYDQGLPINDAVAACLDIVTAADPKHRSTRVREALDALIRHGYLMQHNGILSAQQ